MYWRQQLVFGDGFQTPYPTDPSLATGFTRSIFGAILIARNYDVLISCMRMTGLLSDELRSPKGREAQKVLAEQGLPQGPNQRPRPINSNFRYKPFSMSRSPGTEPVVVDYLDYGKASGHDQILEPVFIPESEWPGRQEPEKEEVGAEEKEEEEGAEEEAQKEEGEEGEEKRSQAEEVDESEEEARKFETMVAGRDEEGTPQVPADWSKSPASQHKVLRAATDPGPGFYGALPRFRSLNIEEKVQELTEELGPYWRKASRQDGMRKTLEWSQGRKPVKQWLKPPPMVPPTPMMTMRKPPVSGSESIGAALDSSADPTRPARHQTRLRPRPPRQPRPAGRKPRAAENA